MRRWTLLVGLVCTLLPHGAAGGDLERGLAIVDPLALRELDLRERQVEGLTHPGFGIGRMLDPNGSGPLRNDRLFALPSMADLRSAIAQDLDSYAQRRRQTAYPQEKIGVGSSDDIQLFDLALLDSSRSRFVLAGIVNRMDRGYVPSETCGEIRLIYRLAATSEPTEGAAVSLRLPMTLNVILKARTDEDAVSCADLARRWRDAGASLLTGADLAISLMAPGGPLDLIRPDHIDRIETNLQIGFTPKSSVREFRTEYLMKSFRYDPRSQWFMQAPLENQIDRDRIAANPGLGAEFRRWLLQPEHLGEFDRGTVLIPGKFLATGAIAAVPAEFSHSDAKAAANKPLFGETDIVTALKRATDSGVVLENIRSVAGFERRLDDVTCSGCHQTRGIGGFHFPGANWIAAAAPGAVPGSPLFLGDQVRRRDIVAAFAEARSPDYARGFSARPQLRGTTALLGTEYYDGWGATCYRPGRDGAGSDRSFQGWTCADGLACQAAGDDAASRIGMCFVGNR